MQTVSIPYSSGHLFRWEQPGRSEPRLAHVSIPYSSGHLFRCSEPRLGWKSQPTRLNPLFIRSSIPLKRPNPDQPGRSRVSIPYSSGHLFRYEPDTARIKDPDAEVSIPYSSGHLFRFGIPSSIHGGSSESQSLIHQVIYSVHKRPLGSRKPGRWSQSLIHQVIYSVAAGTKLTSAMKPGLNPLFIRSSIPLTAQYANEKP